MKTTTRVDLPYEVEEFAMKHGLSLKAAEAILMANRKSKEQADIGAERFKEALMARPERKGTNKCGPKVKPRE